MAVSQRIMNQMTWRTEQIYSGNLLLVNETYPLRRVQTRELITFDPRFPNIFLKRDAAHVLQLILEKISAGDRIVPVSGYRSAEEQADIFENSRKENGEEFTRKYVALPYHSEHQTGLAIDLGLNGEHIDFLCPDFPYEGICQRFRKAAPDYGFIQRYEKDKEQITGISHEPWHFRYVGYPHSKIMAASGMALEEYIAFIKDFREDRPYIYRQENGMEIRIYYISAESKAAPTSGHFLRKLNGMGKTDQTAGPDAQRITDRVGKSGVIHMPDDAVYQISGNNVDGLIVTVWRI